MSQQQRLIRLPLVGLFMLGLLAIAFLVGRKRASDSESSDAVTRHSVDNSPEDALKYWTADRMRKAKPAKMPHVKKVEQEKKPSKRAPRTPDAQES
jgi:hypothetical protein